MKKEIEKLNDEFLTIKKKGWIKSMRRGPTGIGYTFEYLLNKNENSFSIPDFEGIEIKTMRYFSRKKIHLFNATPDGDILFPIKRIIDLIGYPDKDYPKYKIFNASVNGNKFTKIGYKKLKIYVNWKEEKLDLIAYTIFGKKISLQTSWSFDMLEKILNRKLHTLAIVKAYNKSINNDEYFLYHNISFYILKDFTTFIKLIETGIISITFKIGIHKNVEKLGQIYDHGTDFSIDENDISLLFDKIVL